MRRVNALGPLSCLTRRSQPASKREMQTSERVTQTVFLTQLTKETAKDSESDWGWGKG
jgi:hypothetical protein